METIIPQQKIGKEINARSDKEFENNADAKSFFVTVRKRLQDVNHWHRFAGGLSAEFTLVGPTGLDASGSPRKGDYFKIDIPGPGSRSGKGYDWVKVEDIDSINSKSLDRYSFRVRPAENPQTSTGGTAHFYSPESTSTFIVERINNKVFVEIHDRNIKPNTNAKKPLAKARDVMVGTAGMLSFSKIQWQTLVDGLVQV